MIDHIAARLEELDRQIKNGAEELRNLGEIHRRRLDQRDQFVLHQWRLEHELELILVLPKDVQVSDYINGKYVVKIVYSQSLPMNTEWAFYTHRGDTLIVKWSRPDVPIQVLHKSKVIDKL